MKFYIFICEFERVQKNVDFEEICSKEKPKRSHGIKMNKIYIHTYKKQNVRNVLKEFQVKNEHIHVAKSLPKVCENLINAKGPFVRFFFFRICSITSLHKSILSLAHRPQYVYCRFDLLTRRNESFRMRKYPKGIMLC